MVWGAGNDNLFCSAGRDLLLDNAGDDELDGGTSNDVLNGGRGTDLLIGGARADTFVYGLSAGSDVIADFENGTDRIDLSAYGLVAADLSGLGVVIDTPDTAIIDRTLLGGRGEIILAGMSGTVDASDFILWLGKAGDGSAGSPCPPDCTVTLRVRSKNPLADR